jgi:hypothetical protein
MPTKEHKVSVKPPEFGDWNGVRRELGIADYVPFLRRAKELFASTADFVMRLPNKPLTMGVARLTVAGCLLGAPETGSLVSMVMDDIRPWDRKNYPPWRTYSVISGIRLEEKEKDPIDDSFFSFDLTIEDWILGKRERAVALVSNEGAPAVERGVMAYLLGNATDSAFFLDMAEREMEEKDGHVTGVDYRAKLCILLALHGGMRIKEWNAAAGSDSPMDVTGIGNNYTAFSPSLSRVLPLNPICTRAL